MHVQKPFGFGDGLDCLLQARGIWHRSRRPSFLDLLSKTSSAHGTCWTRFLQELGQLTQERCLRTLTSPTTSWSHLFSELCQATDTNQTKACPPLHHKTKDDGDEGPSQCETGNTWLREALRTGMAPASRPACTPPLDSLLLNAD